jgi:hypothetical protein
VALFPTPVATIPANVVKIPTKSGIILQYATTTFETMTYIQLSRTTQEEGLVKGIPQCAFYAMQA